MFNDNSSDGTTGFGGMMGDGMMGFGGGMMVFGGLMMLAVLALIILGIWALVVWLRNTRSRPEARTPTGAGAEGGQNRAREILGERYARGDLTTDEYNERLETLNE
ncbi:SHOCT domain-containing protein [Arthrobacter roseus]|uniref:SHOCT domain-containing protein n=1 Tax=Arthrobacter roseus TaxID=136274 RepID=UPI001EF85BEE|nr:SHOCT domain-containing protein [Arthrobacter roseus]MBM7848697.1 putative membrane protein [Arthrobacter roseus]